MKLVEFKEISIDKLDPNPWQIRENLDDDEGLVASIKQSPLKIRNAPLVRSIKNDRYQIASGHRRVNAAKKIGEKTVWCRVAEISDLEMQSEVLIENVHRKDLTTKEQYNALEQVRTTLGLKKDFYSELAKRTGLSHDQVTKLYDSYRDILPKVKIRRGEYLEKNEPSVAIVYATSGLPESERVKFVEKATEKDWSQAKVYEVKSAIKDVPEKIRTKLIESNLDADSTIKVAESIKPLDEKVSLKLLETKNITPDQTVKISEAIQPLTKEAQIKVIESKQSAPVMVELSKLKDPTTIEQVSKEIRVRRINDEEVAKLVQRVIEEKQPQVLKVKNEPEDVMKELRDMLIQTNLLGVNQYKILGPSRFGDACILVSKMEDHLKWWRMKGWEKKE